VPLRFSSVASLRQKPQTVVQHAQNRRVSLRRRPPAPGRPPLRRCLPRSQVIKGK
jgi:hypothetical protein